MPRLWTTTRAGPLAILGRYIGRTVLAAIATVLAIVVSVFSFLEFIEELDQLGKGRYGIVQVAEYVLLSVPRLTYDLFPVAALVGCMVGIGSLVGNGEVTAMRAAGLSRARTVGAIMQAGVLLMVVALLLGEFVAPQSEQLAQHRRSIATTDQIALKSRYGFWARDGQSFINIRKVLPGNRVEKVSIFELDDRFRLLKTTVARSAYYAEGQWMLEDIRQTVFENQRVKHLRLERAKWESLLDPNLVRLVVVNPNRLSVADLYRYVTFLDNNGQNSLRYRQALWLKLSFPLATGAMVFLGIPIVLSARRGASTGQRVFIGSCVGLVFHITNKTTGALGLVYDLHPALSALFPTVLTLLAGTILMRRVY